MYTRKRVLKHAVLYSSKTYYIKPLKNSGIEYTNSKNVLVTLTSITHRATYTFHTFAHTTHMLAHMHATYMHIHLITKLALGYTRSHTCMLCYFQAHFDKLTPLQVPARNFCPTPRSCPLKCSSKVITVQRRRVFDNFWKSSDFNAQNAYLYGCIKVVEPKWEYMTVRVAEDSCICGMREWQARVM